MCTLNDQLLRPQRRVVYRLCDPLFLTFLFYFKYCQFPSLAGITNIVLYYVTVTTQLTAKPPFTFWLPLTGPSRAAQSVS